MLLPTVVCAALFVAALPLLASAGPRVHAAKTAAAGAVNRPGAMSLLVLVVMLRSWTSLGFTTFIPFYYVDVLREDPQTVGTLLFAFLGAGALGTVGAGMLADRWGMRPMIVWGLLGVLPLAILFLHVTGPLAYVVIALMGAVLISTFTISVVLGQQYMPRNTGMASGLIVGFATGTAGLGVAALGWVADRYGLMSALWISALMPIPGVIAASFLPAPTQTRS
jgi:FSR family fosmidomycin resistance protein-like MFS transporter